MFTNLMLGDWAVNEMPPVLAGSDIDLINDASNLRI